MRWSVYALTYSVPLAATATPRGLPSSADVPRPSTAPQAEPAYVRTAAEAMTMRRTRQLE